MKLNLGSNNKKVEGYINVDILKLENVDKQVDLSVFPYPWGNETIDEILMTEFLEHIEFKKTLNVLKECHRILKPEGKLHVQVPDCGSMMEAYVNDEIDEIIPHKGDEEEIYKLQKIYKKRVHPDRWLFAFCGSQKHKYDIHRSIFTSGILENNLRSAGFKIERINDKLNWKLKYNCYK